MTTRRCTYCKKYYKYAKDGDKCEECVKQFKAVCMAVSKMFSGKASGSEAKQG